MEETVVVARYCLSEGRITSLGGKLLGRVFCEKPGSEAPYTAILSGRGLGSGKTPEAAAQNAFNRHYAYPWAQSEPVSGPRPSSFRR